MAEKNCANKAERPAESSVWRHRNDPGRFRKTSVGFEPEGHQERILQGPSSQPQVDCFTCQACRTALQPLGLFMRLQARFPAILSTPQDIGCLWTWAWIQQVAAACIAHYSHSLEALSQPVGATRALCGLLWVDCCFLFALALKSTSISVASAKSEGKVGRLLLSICIGS